MRKLRIAVLNNYDLKRVEKEVENGEVPNHLLFGINHLRDYGHLIENFSVKIDRNLEEKYRITSGIYKFFTHFENLNLQKKVYKRSHEFDLIFCLSGGVSEWLHYQYSQSKLHTPILTIFHHPLPEGKLDFIRNRFRRSTFKKQNLLLSLSKKTSQSFNKVIKNEITKSIPWGVDYNFYTNLTKKDPLLKSKRILLSCGRTARDLNTLVRAAIISEVKTKIICEKNSIIPLHRKNNFISFEQTTYSCCKEENTYQLMASRMHEVMAIAIPLEKQSTLAGLTSLMDCLGFGKPVIMTRNPCIDIDIEKIGIGHWIDPYDVDGWVNAIKWHASNKKKSLLMGKKAREFGKKISSNLFGENINRIILNFHQNHQIYKENIF